MHINKLYWFREKKIKPTAAASKRENKNPGTNFSNSCRPLFCSSSPRHKKKFFLPWVEGHISPPAPLLRHLMPIAWINRPLN